MTTGRTRGRPALHLNCTTPGCPGHSVRTMTTYTSLNGITARRHLCSEGHRFTSYDGGAAHRPVRAPRVAALPVLTEWRPYPFTEATT